MTKPLIGPELKIFDPRDGSTGSGGAEVLRSTPSALETGSCAGAGIFSPNDGLSLQISVGPRRARAHAAGRDGSGASARQARHAQEADAEEQQTCRFWHRLKRELILGGAAAAGEKVEHLDACPALSRGHRRVGLGNQEVRMADGGAPFALEFPDGGLDFIRVVAAQETLPEACIYPHRFV